MSDAAVTPEAERLADVLACLTTEGSAAWWRSALLREQVRVRDDRVEVFAKSHERWCRLRAWRFDDPAEAAEALQAADLAPADDARRAWLHFDCYECGLRGAPPSLRCCPRCSSGERNDRLAPRPQDVGSLASVAALGLAGWRTAEDLARVVERDAAVVWRVGRAQALGGRDAGGVSASRMFLRGEPSADEWFAFFTRYDASDLLLDAVAALARIGVWVVTHDRGRVTLAVDAP